VARVPREGASKNLNGTTNPTTNTDGTSDFEGVVYEPFDTSGGWRQALGRELEAAGSNIAPDRIGFFVQATLRKTCLLITFASGGGSAGYLKNDFVAPRLRVGKLCFRDRSRPCVPEDQSYQFSLFHSPSSISPHRGPPGQSTAEPPRPRTAHGPASRWSTHIIAGTIGDRHERYVKILPRPRGDHRNMKARQFLKATNH
jgi:hypothetical protein